MTDAAEVEIVRLGAEGDGVAQTVRGPVFVPFALPGERWRDNDGVWQRMSDGTERRAAPCRHFGRCGGCVAQHMSAELYARWKRDMLVEAFRHRGLNAEVEALRTVSERSRRRAFLGVERHGPEVVVGFREEGSHTLVDIEECLVLEPAIMAALGAMKEIARLVMPEDEGGRLVVTRLDHGLDVSFDNGRKDLAPETRAAAARIATDARFIRLTIAGEPVAELGAPVVTLGGVEVEPPQGAFLQAVPEAEAHLVELVVGALPKRAKRVADLFSGLGTFAFPLGRRVASHRHRRGPARNSRPRARGAQSDGPEADRGDRARSLPRAARRCASSSASTRSSSTRRVPARRSRPSASPNARCRWSSPSRATRRRSRATRAC